MLDHENDPGAAADRPRDDAREPRSHADGDAHRLLDVTLREHLGRTAGRADDDEALARAILARPERDRERAWRTAAAAADGAGGASGAPVVRTWWLAAGVLLGLGVVAGTLYARWRTPPAADEPARWALPPSQDPQPERQTTPRDLEHFLELVRAATKLRVVGCRHYGATRRSDSVDVLDVETTRGFEAIEGAQLAAWQDAVVASAARVERTLRIDGLLLAHFTLPDGSELRATFGTGSEQFIDPELDLGVIRPNDALRALLGTIDEKVQRDDRLARGIVQDAADLERLAADAASITCPAEWGGSLLARLQPFAQLRSLRLVRGATGAPVDRSLLTELASLPRLEAIDVVATGLTDADTAVLATWPALRRVTLREAERVTGAGLAALPAVDAVTFDRCASLGAVGLRTLAKARSLRELTFDGCELGAKPEVLEALAAFPSLQSLAVRDETVQPLQLRPLLRSKLRTLTLVDVPAAGADLAAFVELPSLRELAVLTPTLGDTSVEELGALRQLQRLRLQNVKLSPDGFAALRAELPKCEVEGVPGQRLFDTARFLLRR